MIACGANQKQPGEAGLLLIRMGLPIIIKLKLTLSVFRLPTRNMELKSE